MTTFKESLKKSGGAVKKKSAAVFNGSLVVVVKTAEELNIRGRMSIGSKYIAEEIREERRW